MASRSRSRSTRGRRSRGRRRARSRRSARPRGAWGAEATTTARRRSCGRSCPRTPRRRSRADRRPAAFGDPRSSLSPPAAGRGRLAEAAQAPHCLQVALVDLVDELVEGYLAAMAMDAAMLPGRSGPLQRPQQLLAQRGEPVQQVPELLEAVGGARRAPGARGAPGAARRIDRRSPARRAGPPAPSRAGSRRSRGSTSPRAAPPRAAGGASASARPGPRSAAGPRARPRAGP